MALVTGMEPGAANGVTSSAPEEELSSPLWKRACRVLLFLLFLAVGSVTAGGRPRNGIYYSSTSEVVQALVEGALIALVFLAVAGSVGHLIARRRGSGRSWGASVTTFPVLLVTVVLLVLSAAGRASQQQAALTNAAPDPTGSLVQREKANLDAQAWARSRAPVERALVATLAQTRSFIKTFGTDGNTRGIRQIATHIERAFVQEQANWRALPQAPLADIRQLDVQAISGLELAAAGYAEYAAGLRANAARGLSLKQDRSALALLNRGDAKLNIAERRFQAFQTQLRALDQRYSLN